jgi:hypothetical protein
MPNRIEISPAGKPLPCEACGRETLHVARILSATGALLGKTLICTTCRPQRPAGALRRAA